jgi:multidrug transporter EmrE-like cation transporter
MLDDMLAYFISFGVIATGASFIGVGWNSTTSAIWIGIGVALIVVGAISILGELQNRMR